MERQFGPYRLVRQVAVGGMAEIHLAKAKGIAGFEKYVALKMIHPNFAEDEQFIEMLVDEAKIAVQLTHHNIAQTFDLGRVGDTYYISMEYVDGADLYKVLRRASEQDIEFPLDVCAFIAKEVASGLDYAHRKRDVTGQQLGIVHRDVSPQNVLLSYAGEVKLVDFGIAKATMKVKQTAAGVIKGKYYYMSPEQASGGSVDARSDIFSAGIVLYEMLTGQMLYLEEDLHRLLEMVRRANIAPPSKLRRGIPPQLERIVMHALARTPLERYQSGADMASDLERFLHAYSPVFTPGKMVALLRRSVGDPTLNMESEQVEVAVLDENQLMREPGEMRDSNSVIFRVKPRPLNDFPPIDTNAATDSGVAEPPTQRRAESEAGGNAAAGIGESTTKGVTAAEPRPPRRLEGKRPSRDQPKVRAPTAPLTMPPSGDPMQSDLDLDDDPAPQRRTAAPRISRPHGAVSTNVSRDFHEDTRELPESLLREESPAPRPAAKPIPSMVGADKRSAPPVRSTAAMAPTTAAPPLVTAITALPLFGTEDLEGGDSTLVSSMPFQPDPSSFDGEVENTLVQARVPVPEHTDYGETQVRSGPPRQDGASADDDGPTTPGRRPHQGQRPSRPPAAPAALAAKNPTPSVSELRRPRPSRSTPAGGSPSLLQAIVAAPGSEPMPTAPRTAPPPLPPRATPPPMPVVPPLVAATGLEPTQPAQPTYVPVASPMQATSFSLPPAPPAMLPPSAAPTLAGAAHSGAVPLPTAPTAMNPSSGPVPTQIPGSGPIPSAAPIPSSGPIATMTSPPLPTTSATHDLPPAFAHLSAQYPPQTATTGQHPTGFANGSYPPGQSYPPMYHQSGAFPQGMPATMTGRMRALEIDEIPPQYLIKRDGPRWFVLAAIALIAVATAATVTFFVLRANRQAAVASASIRVESMPAGATVYVDDKQLPDPTPVLYKDVAPGQRYKVRVELRRHVSYVEEVVIGKTGGELALRPILMPVTGTLNITSQPPGADIIINGALFGRTPKQVRSLDLDNVKKVELRLAKYDPYQQEIEWGEQTELSIDATLVVAGTKPR